MTVSQRYAAHAALALACLLFLGARIAEAESSDVRGAIYAAAHIHGVDPEPLIALVDCETAHTFDADAKGDYRWQGGRFIPTSRGPAQLNDLETGLAHHFWDLGYTDRTDPEQAADYLARVAAGEFLPGQPGAPPLHPTGIVSLKRWTCWRLQHGGR